MGLSTKEFWRLFARCRLRTTAECRELFQRFSQTTEAQPPDNRDQADLSARWLLAQGELTRFQAKVLLSGRAGPFVYGPYQLRDRIVGGRLAGSYRAIHAATRHPALLWFLSGPDVESQKSYDGVVAQSAAACHVVHPCLSQTYQLVDLGDFKFLALEDLHGASAKETLASGGRLPPRDACRAMRHVALAAAAMHDFGFVHGDIRPHNVWIDTPGNGRLLQFPLALATQLPHGSSPLALSEEERLVLADYAAPELAFPGQSRDALADVYAIGCTLYELLSGRPPFAGGSQNGGVAEKMNRHATEPIEPLEPLGVPPELAKVVAFAMAKDRKVRYHTAAQLAESLAYFVEPKHASAMPQPARTFAEFQSWLSADGSASAALVASRLEDSPSSSAESDENAAGDADPFAFLDREHTTRSPTARIRAQRHRSRNSLIFAAALLLALCFGGGLGYVMSNRGDPAAETHEAENGPTQRVVNSTSGEPIDAAGAKSGELVTIPDDGKTLWAPPVAGTPIRWDYLPPRAEVVVVVRPAELLRHREGEKLLAALGPHGASAITTAERAIGMPLAEVEQLTVAWSNIGGNWTATYVVRPAAAHTAEQLAARWQSLKSAGDGDARHFVAGELAYAAPTAEQGSLFIVSTAGLMPELLSAGSKGAPLMRDMVRLLQTSDSSRLATLIFTRSALFVDAEPRFAAAGLDRLHRALGWLLRDDVKAAAISLHLDDHCYLETRIVGNAQTTTPRQLAAEFQARRKQLPLDVEDHVSQTGLHPYSSRLLIRLGAMARYVERQLRIEAEGDQVVINAYLPAVAAHNIALAAELAIVQPAAGQAAPAESPAPTATANAASSDISERLRKPVSLSFERETLERSIQLLSTETGVPMEIQGSDLQLEGITKNQSFGINEVGKPAVEILHKIMRAANPDGKLVYVIKPATPGGENVLFITTRSAAQKRGDKFAPELAATQSRDSAKTGRK